MIETPFNPEAVFLLFKPEDFFNLQYHERPLGWKVESTAVRRPRNISFYNPSMLACCSRGGSSRQGGGSAEPKSGGALVTVVG